MIKLTKILAAVAVAGVVAVGGSAFTASGLTKSAVDPFIGGEQTVSVIGGDLANVAYQIVDGSNGHVDAIALTFAGVPDASAVSVVVTGSASSGAVDGFTCTNVTTDASTCSPTLAGVAAPGEYYSALEDVTVTVTGEES